MANINSIVSSPEIMATLRQERAIYRRGVRRRDELREKYKASPEYKQYMENEDRTPAYTEAKKVLVKAYPKALGIQRRIENVKKIMPQESRASTGVQSAFLKAFGGGSSRSSQGSNRPVGRPRGVFRHTSPITGKAIPATVYYKELRNIRRQQSNLAQQRQLAYQQAMARRGIQPQQVQAQMPQQQVIARPMPQQQQIQPQRMPIQPIQQQPRSIWNRQGYVAQEVDAFGRVRQVVRGRPESFWN
jgi:hypothetical protein